jgi:hypothetical protein
MKGQRKSWKDSELQRGLAKSFILGDTAGTVERGLGTRRPVEAVQVHTAKPSKGSVGVNT